ncbi:MAG: hypothetical protein EA395_00175 [Phormidium sp. GEM2.Bin31]|nr:hypothetical protein [Phormidium sp. BM_Day4_Bin.17]TVR16658.1 MAG: hypothetical protein EA395_00175 [Phormidium sp. GEM2.Bin31]UCJ12695.1 MAG: hypothetical protein JWS08_02450 [Phormidium sp. PBR-2020]
MISRWKVWVVLAGLPILTACGQVTELSGEDIATSSQESPQDTPPEANSEPSAEVEETETPEVEEAESDALPVEGTVYRHPEGLFEISFPPNYAWQPQPNGLSFLSANGKFGGEVIYFEVEDTLTTEALEELYRQRAQEVFREIAWQRSELQPDGSVRLDWRGKNAGGQDLDAIGYIEQHGNRVYILNVYAINESYDIYLEDSRLIVGSYQVNRNP